MNRGKILFVCIHIPVFYLFSVFFFFFFSRLRYRSRYLSIHPSYKKNKILPLWFDKISAISYAIYIYILRELRATRDRLLTKTSPLCSPANARFVNMLSHAPSMLPRCCLMFSQCSPVLPRRSLVLPFSHFLLSSSSISCKFKRDPWCSWK